MKSCRKQFEDVNSMEKVEISQEMVKIQCRKIRNQKALGKDGVQEYYIIARTYSSAAKPYP